VTGIDQTPVGATSDSPNPTGSGRVRTPRAEFGVHILNTEGISKARNMATQFSDLLDWLEQPGMCVMSPELTIAKRKLEEACFYAKKAMATNLVNQQH